MNIDAKTNATNGQVPTSAPTHNPALSPAPDYSKQMPLGPGTVPTPNAEQDRINRRRNIRGDRLPNSYAFDQPTAGRTKAEESKYKPYLEKLAERLPLAAAKLEHEYDDKLHYAFKNVADTKANAREELEALQKLSLLRDHEYEQARQVIEEEKAEATAELLTTIEAQQADLGKANESASLAFSVAGATLNPDNPCEEDALAVNRLTPEQAAARLAYPYEEPSPPSFVERFLLGAGIVLIGSLIGVSIALIAGMLHAARIQDQLGVLIVAALVGMALAKFSHSAVYKCYEIAARAAYAPQSHMNVAIKYISAFAVSFALFAADVVTERMGILKLASQRQQVAGLSGIQVAEAPEYVYYTMAAVITLGFFIHAAATGFARGRTAQVLVRAHALIEEDFAQRVAARRAQPAVQNALEKLGIVLEKRRKLRQLKADLASVEAPFDARLQDFASRRFAYPTAFSDRQEKSIQEANDQYHGTQTLIDLFEKKAHQRAEPVGSFFQRLKELFFPLPSTRRKESKRS